MRAIRGYVLLAAVVVVVVVAGCSSPPTPTPAPGTSTTGSSTRSPEQLRSALLGAADVPAGWTVYASSTATGTQTVSTSVTSTDPACAGFLDLVKDPPDPLPPDQAEVQLDGGNLTPPYVVESLQAYPSASAAAARLAQQQQDIAACRQVTYTVEGATSPVTVAVEPPPAVSVPATGARLTAQGGGLSGYDARIVVAQAGATVVSLTFLKASDDQRASLTTAAVAKVGKVLG